VLRLGSEEGCSYERCLVCFKKTHALRVHAKCTQKNDALSSQLSRGPTPLWQMNDYPDPLGPMGSTRRPGCTCCVAVDPLNDGLLSGANQPLVTAVSAAGKDVLKRLSWNTFAPPIFALPDGTSPATVNLKSFPSPPAVENAAVAAAAAVAAGGEHGAAKEKAPKWSISEVLQGILRNGSRHWSHPSWYAEMMDRKGSGGVDSDSDDEDAYGGGLGGGLASGLAPGRSSLAPAAVRAQHCMYLDLSANAIGWQGLCILALAVDKRQRLGLAPMALELDANSILAEVGVRSAHFPEDGCALP